MPLVRHFATIALMAIFFVVFSCPALAQIAPDYGRLSQPDASLKNNLTNEQRTNLAPLLQQRAKILTQAESAERNEQLAKVEGNIKSQLTDVQIQELSQPKPGIKFQFRETPWIDVLEWFAKQSGRSLVVNESPPDSFTYSDTKEYTAIEGLDLLNGVLIDRGFALIRRDRLIICVNLSKGIPASLVPETTIEKLNEFGNFELVRVIFRAGGRPLDAISNEIQPLIGKHGSQVPLPQTGRILVTTEAGRMRMVAATIEAISPPKPAPPKPKAGPKPPPPLLVPYDVKSIDAKATAELLKQLIGGVQLSVDEKAGRISVFAVPSQQAVVKKSIDLIKADVVAEGKPELETIPFASEDAEMVLQQLNTAIPDASIIHDAAKRRLLVFANPAEQKQVAQILAKLQVSAPVQSGDSGIEVFPLLNADATAVAESLNSLFPTARISAETTNNSLLVRGSLADKELLARVIARIDIKRANQASPEFHDFNGRVSEELLAGLKAVAPDAVVTVQRQGLRLMIVGSAEDHRALQVLLNRYREELKQEVQETLRVFEVTPDQRTQFVKIKNQLDPRLEEMQILDSPDKSKLAILGTESQHEATSKILADIELKLTPQIRQMVSYPIDSRIRQRLNALKDRVAPELKPITIVDSGDKQTLTVIATSPEHAALEKLIADLQKNFPPEVEDELKLYQVAPKLKARFLELAPQLNDRLGQIRIVNDARPNELVIWAKPEQHIEIKATLASIEKQIPLEDDSLEIYTVKPKLKTRFLAQVPNLADRIGEIKVVEGAAENELSIWATQRQHEEVQALIDTLKAQAPAPARRLAAYAIENADLMSVDAVVKELFPDVKTLVAEDSQKIMVWAEDETQETIRSAIKNIDIPSAKASNQRVVYYPLGQLDARDIARLIERLLPKMAIVVDRGTNSIVAWGTEKQHELLRQTTEDFKKQGDEKHSVQVYPCGHRDPRGIRRLIASLAPDAKLIEDSDTRTLAAWATPEEHQIIEAAMIKLTAAKNQGSLVVYPTPTTDADRVIAVLRRAVPDAQFADAAADTKVLAWATKDEHIQIQTVIDHLEEKDPLRAKRVMKTFSTNPNTAQNIVELLRDVVPQAKVIRGSNDQSVIVWATEDDLSIATPLIEKLLGDAGRQRLEAYEVDPRTATQLAELISDGFDGASTYRSSDDRQLFVFADPDDQKVIATTVTTWQARVQSKAIPEVRVYPVGDADPESIFDAIPADLKEEGTIVRDTKHQALIVTASPAQHLVFDKAMKEILSNLPAVKERVAKVYRLKVAEPSAAYTTLAALLPQVSLAVDSSSRSIVATASTEDQKRIADVIAKLDVAEPTSAVSKVYKFQIGDPSVAQAALAKLLPRASLTVDTLSRSLIVTAAEEEHEKIAAIVAQVDAPTDSNSSSQVYRFKVGDPNAAQLALSSLLPRARMAVDAGSRSLIATATSDEHKTIQSVVTQMDIEKTSTAVTKVYQLTVTDPNIARSALQASMPTATIVADSATGTMLVTGSENEHQQIEQTIKQLDQATPRTQAIQAYSVTKSDVNAIYQTLRQTFEKTPNVTLAVDPINGSILVKASPANHRTIAMIVARMESPVPTKMKRVLEFYRVDAANPGTVLTGINALLTEARPKPSVSLDENTGQLVVVATADQQQLIQSAIDRLAPDKTDVDVFRLSALDPYTVESAIDQLFAETADAPIVSSDLDTQQLIVRGTEKQMSMIRDLLSKMGETQFGDQPSGNGTSRVVPFGSNGDIDAAIQQLQDIWPRLRSNKIQVMKSRAVDYTPILTEPPTDAETNSVETESDASTINKTQKSDSNQAEAIGVGELQAAPDGCDGEIETGEVETGDVETRDVETRDVETRDVETRDVETREVETRDEPAEEGEETDAQKRQEEAQATEEPTADAAPVLIVPGRSSITISSKDVEALSQVEMLLRTIAQQSRSGGSAGNFAVYPLRNAGASKVAKLMGDLFKQMPETNRTSLGRVSIVADDRLNAVVAHGRQADRKVLSELLQVLDSDNTVDALANARPQIISVRNTDANRILKILKSVYQSQLTSGGKRPDIEIPEGVSAGVASVLQQINASTAGPILTLEVDNVTNSIVVMAPNQLAAQVQALIERLDKNASTQDARAVKIIKLREITARELEGSLRDLINRN